MDLTNGGGAPAPEPTPAPTPEPTPAPTPEPNPAPTGGTPAPEPTPAPTPEPIEYTFNLPEGMTISDEQKASFSAIANEAHLTQAQADSLIKMHADIVMSQMREAEAVKAKWTEESTKQGLDSKENLAAAKLAVDTFGGGEAMQALVDSGAAYHPAVQKMLQKIGHILNEDNAPDGKAKTPTPAAADLLFTNSKYD